MAALIYTLGGFGLILVLARLKVPLALSIFLGAATCGLLFGLSAQRIVEQLVLGAVQPRTIGLAVITFLLLAVSAAMQQGGQMEQIVTLAKALFRRPAVTMAALPALIGLLPMPGGALFSAPMVASAAGDGHVEAGKLSAINYWFRHVWEHWWPLYPGVITALALTELDVVPFVVTQFPLGLFMIVGGLLIFRKTHPSLHVSSAEAPRGTRGKLLVSTSSIWLILLLWAAGRVLLHFAPVGRLTPELAKELRKYLPLAVALVISWAWTMRLNRLAASDAAKKLLANGRIWSIVLLVVSVMVFQHVLEAVGAAGKIGEGLSRLHVPVVLVMVALPYIAGMVTGLAVGFVGTSFPIVLALIPPGESIRPYVALAYAFGHLGQMCSPLHLCHVVSNRYFKTPYGPVYRQMLPAVAVVAVLSSIYFVLLLRIL